MRLSGIVGLGLLAATLGATAAPQERPVLSHNGIAEPASVVIACDLSPFGKASPVIRDLEPMMVLSGTGGSFFDEYRPSTVGEVPPLQRVYRANLIQAPLSAVTFRRAVNADLNGDGRDEVIAAFSDGADVRLAVYSRTAGPTAQVIDTWSFTETVDPNTIGIVAGDLDGSNDKQQEIALTWTITGGVDSGKTRVVVLKGDSTAHIVQGDNSVAGKYLAAYPSLQFPRLAVGDFLLAGRDQLVLATYSPLSGNFVLDLLEFDDGSNPASLVTVLASNGQHIRSNSYLHLTAGGGASGTFDVDAGPNIAMQKNGSNGIVEAFDAHGGDMVDTAASELVLHVMFPEPVNPVSHVLAARVLHFVTTRSAQNVITGIQLGTVSFLGTSLNLADSSMMLERYTSDGSNGYPPKFDAIVADVDAIAGKEIVTARAGHDGSQGQLFGPLAWFAHKVEVRLDASFQYENQGIDGGTSQPIVAFINNSRGGVASYDWDFGDGSPHSGSRSPVHRYDATGNHVVVLTITGYDNVTQAVYQNGAVAVTGGSDATPQGVAPPLRTYRIVPTAAFSYTDPSYSYPTDGVDTTVIRVAVGDTNRDSLPEVMVAVNNDGISVDKHVYKRQADGSFGHTSSDEYLPNNAKLDLLFSDFDGDSLNAVLSGVSGDCRATVDQSVRSQTWMPPYFSILQQNSNRSTRYGKSTSNSNSSEERSASYMSHDVTAFLGFGYEFSAPVLAIKLSEVEVKGNLGYNYQKTTGELHGDENEFSIDQGWSIGDDNQSLDQEALLTTETTNAACYQYQLVTSIGPVAGSVMRSCQTNIAPKELHGPGARDWNELTDEQLTLPITQVPLTWVPMQRDWASRALFHAPTAGVATGALTFIAARGADKATDGLFTTAAESNGTFDKPYLQVDLGSVREIDSVRVFPKADAPSAPGAFEPLDFKTAVKDLAGFRLFVSASPFVGNGLPTAATNTTVVPNGISTFVQDVGDEESYRVWNVWTGDPATAKPIKGRYLRLQKRAAGKIAISEIQVFGDTHSEPQYYPDAVCDDRVGDGLFKALIYDAVNRANRVIDVRGDMIWTGAVDYVNATPQPSGVPNCTNDSNNGSLDSLSPATVRQEPIWQDISIGDAGSADWALSQSHSKTNATDSSIENSVHVGVEFESKQGPGAHVITGAAYEFSYGVTQDSQSSQTFGTGFAVSGVIGGFENAALAPTCHYFPRPYAFSLADTSNTGFKHAMYVTDYVVRQIGRGVGNWQRDSLPSACSNDVSDRIFADNFE